jgi:hypothetical protein
MVGSIASVSMIGSIKLWTQTIASARMDPQLLLAYELQTQLICTFIQQLTSCEQGTSACLGGPKEGISFEQQLMRQQARSRAQ